MKYQSTRKASYKVKFSEAISTGLAPDGGLFVPCRIPKLKYHELRSLVSMPYYKVAYTILKKYLTDYPDDLILEYCKKAYNSGQFEDDMPAQIAKIGDEFYTLELWHGPTGTFKDVALQILPYFLNKSETTGNPGKRQVILTGTSGDTGSAALAGFSGAEDKSVAVFYPSDGVSVVQKYQMTTQRGNNVFACGVNGSLDEIQSEIKNLINDPEITSFADENGVALTSANSINWGRLVPQIVYYFSAYCDLVRNKYIKIGDDVNFVVPTGNFGNIMAGYYAKHMGLPISKLICSSNNNKVLTDFFTKAVYDTNRDLVRTESPSLDIIVSSNLERLLFHESLKDTVFVSQRMQDLYEHGEYRIDASIEQSLYKQFFAGYADDSQTSKVINRIFTEYGYVTDPHTAVGIHVYEQYKMKTGDSTPTVVISTASPYKFPEIVINSLGIEPPSLSQDELFGYISARTHTEIPYSVRDLFRRKIRFNGNCQVSDLKEVIMKYIGQQNERT